MSVVVRAIVCYPNPPREKGLDEYLRIDASNTVGVTGNINEATQFEVYGHALAMAQMFLMSPSGRPAVVKSLTTRVIYDISHDLTKVPGYADVQSGT